MKGYKSNVAAVDSKFYGQLQSADNWKFFQSFYMNVA